MLVVNDKLKIPIRELSFTFSRSSGPGGQNVNKVNTKATLRWCVKRTRSLPEPVRKRLVARYGGRLTSNGELLVTSQRFRDQARNVADCLRKLRDMIASVAEAPKVRKPTRPTAAARAVRRRGKEAQSRKKQLRRKPLVDE